MGLTRADREALEAIVKDNECAACRAGLLVAMHPDGSGYTLRCGRCNVYRPDYRPRHEESIESRYLRGGQDALSGLEMLQLHNRLRGRLRRADAEGREPWPRDLRIMERIEREMQQLTPFRAVAEVSEEEASRFVSLAKFTNDQDMVTRAVEMVRRTGLNPMIGELTVYENRLYVAVAGLRHLLVASPIYEGEEEPVFLSREQRLERGYAEDDIVCQVRLYRKGRRGVILGEGKASRDPNRIFRSSQVEKFWPVRTAENRAFRQAMVKGFQDLLSGAGLEMEPDEEAGTAMEEPAMVVTVDRETGEILTSAPMPQPEAPLEGEFSEAAPTPEPAGQGPMSPAQRNQIAALMRTLGWDKNALDTESGQLFAKAARDLDTDEAEQFVRHLRLLSGNSKGVQVEF